MEEINELHTMNLEWGCITNLLDKISDIEDKIDGGWPELVDMVADAVTMESQNPDPTEIFFTLHSFLWRLYYRIKRNPNKQSFNQYVKITNETNGGDGYGIKYYDYNIYKWAIKNGFTERIDNNLIEIRKDKLNDKQQRAFERRCK